MPQQPTSKRPPRASQSRRTTSVRYGDPFDPGPTDDEIEAWAVDDRRRRQAWADGPTDTEKRLWALEERDGRERRGLPPGSAPFVIGPTDEEINEWAAEEHKRRQAWLQGPSDAEKQEWARFERERRIREDGRAALGPTDEEIQQWADDDRKRRQAWLEGPTEAEKLEWAQQERARRLRSMRRTAPADPYRPDAGRRWFGLSSRWWEESGGPYGRSSYSYGYGRSGPHRYGSTVDPYGPDWAAPEDRYEAYSDYGARTGEHAARLQRDVELATRGAWYMLTEGPYRAWQELVDAGQEWESQFFEPARRTRVRLYDDWD